MKQASFIVLSVVSLLGPPAGALAQDGDADGVPDVRDICPATRTGRTVDPAGCDAFCEVVHDAVGGSAFLRSRLLEVGTADWGSFGTATAAPVGWHPRGLCFACLGRELGFVANPADDDWTVFVGDFFVPGTPEEGFGMNVSVAGVPTDFFTSRLMGERGIVGDFTGIRVECRPRICGLRGGGSVYWTGSVPASGISIDQTYSVFNEGLFILIEVTLRNTTASTQTVYYMRNVDPDNMQSVTGDFSTRNTIVSQGTGLMGSLAHVSATTPITTRPGDPASYIALASLDPDARVTTGGFSERDPDGHWNCSTAGLPGYLCTVGAVREADEAITLTVRKIIPAGESRSFSFVYTLSDREIATSIMCTVPAICGDGRVEGTEACDDGDTMAGDGCDAACDIETGWDCVGSPSVCTPICGDMLVRGSEVCDDGNTESCDGCNATCTATDVDGCLVMGSCVADGTPHPTLPCAACIASVSRLGYTSRPAGSPCDDGDFCTDPDVCSDEGECGGTPRDCDDMLACTADRCDETADACVSAVTDGCLIDGSCVADGAGDALNPCRVCDPTMSTDAFSPRPVGTRCGDPSCSMGTLTPAATCNATGDCVPGTPMPCPDGSICADDMMCAAGCTDDTECRMGFYCEAGMCVPLRPIGDPCTRPGMCASALCVDGVCCEDGCTGVCEACDIAGDEGACLAIPRDTDPDDECEGDLVCDGMGMCYDMGAVDAGVDAGVDSGPPDAGTDADLSRFITRGDGFCSMGGGARGATVPALLLLALLVLAVRRRRR
jgi:MYXO-CTERM domain-containing protein